MFGGKREDNIKKTSQPFDLGSFRLPCHSAKEGTQKKQGGEEDEFKFGYIEFEGSLVPLRVVSFRAEDGGRGSGKRLGLDRDAD